MVMVMVMVKAIYGDRWSSDVCGGVVNDGDG